MPNTNLRWGLPPSPVWKQTMKSLRSKSSVASHKMSCKTHALIPAVGKLISGKCSFENTPLTIKVTMRVAIVGGDCELLNSRAESCRSTSPKLTKPMTLDVCLSYTRSSLM